MTQWQYQLRPSWYVCMPCCKDTSGFSHHRDVIMRAIASQITGVSIFCLMVCSDQRKHQSSASLAFVRGIYRSPMNSPHKRPVTRKMFPFDDVIMDLHNHFEHSLFHKCKVIYIVYRCIRSTSYSRCNILVADDLLPMWHQGICN